VPEAIVVPVGYIDDVSVAAHLTCRGNGKKEIFLGDEDHKDFLEKLSLSLDIYNVSLLASR